MFFLFINTAVHVMWSRALHPLCSFSRLGLLNPFQMMLLIQSVEETSPVVDPPALHWSGAPSHPLTQESPNLTTLRNKAQLLRITAQTHGSGNEGKSALRGAL